MRPRLNTFVDLVADFPKPDYRTEVPGKDLAELLARALRARGIDVLSIEGTDIAHYIRCRSGRREFKMMVSVDDFKEVNRWQILCPSTLGVIDHWLGRTDHDDHQRLLLAIDETLRESDTIHGVRWFPAYESPEYLDLLVPCEGPIRDPLPGPRVALIVRLDRFLDRLLLLSAFISLPVFALSMMAGWLQFAEFYMRAFAALLLGALGMTHWIGAYIPSRGFRQKQQSPGILRRVMEFVAGGLWLSMAVRALVH